MDELTEKDMEEMFDGWDIGKVAERLRDEVRNLKKERDRQDANLVDAISKMKKYSEWFATMQQERDQAKAEAIRRFQEAREAIIKKEAAEKALEQLKPILLAEHARAERGVIVADAAGTIIGQHANELDRLESELAKTKAALADAEEVINRHRDAHPSCRRPISLVQIEISDRRAAQSSEE